MTVSTINDLFRSFHSIKGVTGVLLGVLKEDNHCLDSAKDISLVSHSFETLLTIIRDRNLNFKKENIDLSYEVVDYLKACISVISGISEVVIPAQAIREKLIKKLKVYQMTYYIA